MNNQKQTSADRKYAIVQFIKHIEFCNSMMNKQYISDYVYEVTGERTKYDELRLEWNRKALMLKTNQVAFCKYCTPKLQLSSTYGEFGKRNVVKEKLNLKYGKFGIDQ